MANTNDKQGWVKIYRRFLQWEWYDSLEMTRLFLHLLLKANFKPAQWHGITIPAGSLVTSRAQLAKETNLSEQTVRTCLKRLISTNEITIETTNGYTLITICKYSDYQGDSEKINQPTNQDSNQQLTSEQPATNQRLTTNKEYKEYNKNNNLINSTTTSAAEREVLNDKDLMSYYFQGNFNTEIESLGRELKMTIGELKETAAEVLNDWKLTGEVHADRVEQRRHFVNHLRKKAKVKKKEAAPPAAAPRGRAHAQPSNGPIDINARWANYKLPTDNN